VRAVNLIPAEERRGAGGIAGRSGGVVYVVTGGLAVLVLLGVLYAVAVHGVAQRKGQLAGLVSQVAAVNAETQALQPYVEIASISAEKVQQVAALAEQRFDWPDALNQLALALPNDVSLTSLTAGAGQAAAAAATPTSGSGNPFALVGCANSQGEIPAVLSNLSLIPGVTNVSLVSTVVASTSGYHGLSTKLNHGGDAHGDDPVASTCPHVTWTVNLSYAASYTVPKVKLPQGSSSGAQTVSTGSGANGAAAASTIVQTASRVTQ
jgi:Tfp pilus assembly protein PilN